MKQSIWKPWQKEETPISRDDLKNLLLIRSGVTEETLETSIDIPDRWSELPEVFKSDFYRCAEQLQSGDGSIMFQYRQAFDEYIDYLDATYHPKGLRDPQKSIKTWYESGPF